MDATFWTAFAALATLATAIITSIYTFYTGKMVKGELGPKLHVKARVLESFNEYDKKVNEDIGFPEDFKKLGFVSDIADRKWVVRIVNNGKSPATNIVLKYTLVLYKHRVQLNSDGFPNEENAWLGIYKEINRIMVVEYLPPDDVFEQTVLYMDRFPRVDFKINKLYCDGHDFISKDVTVLRQSHPAFEVIGDSDDARRLLGIQWAENEKDTKVGASSR
jgi:hypothetical protein